MDKFEGEVTLKGQAEIWQYMFNFIDSMTLRCAVELRISDIINSHGRPITLSQIANGINSSTPPNVCYLTRILRFLVRKNILTAATAQSNNGDTVYGLTPLSIWLLHDAELTLAPLILMQTHPGWMSPWHRLSDCIKEGGLPFEKAHGVDLWNVASSKPDFNRVFNDAMECTAEIVTRAIILGYKDGFDSIRSLVDVAGGTGKLISEIVKAYPHINGTNFDLPHVVATAPEYDGVVSVGGDMFTVIPNADAICMKWILHDWGDEECVKILKNCRDALREKTGKVIIIETILEPDGDDLFDNTGLYMDLAMLTITSGKERTELEWKILLENGGFPNYKITKLTALWSLIEASQN